MQSIKLKDKEIRVQLALGTFNIFLLYALVQETKNPVILTAAAKTFTKLEVGDSDFASPRLLGAGDANLITNAFMNNEHTPPLVKSYVMVARQIKNLKRSRTKLINTLQQEKLKKEFEKIHQQLFFDN